ncbi:MULTISPECIES: lipid II:glycine glycyltransferase FemX [Catenuloplanes]|uniref:Lipid II:glycine glycyltransferase (Peptidoglycan interpeptide bridge formation enzyme) n=1 Tax=Catenuloplanes niger TaxID=587534 RepID=A0AAE3ZMK2_9ACTN|nr:peptidoglycan bridge formation glycyltransferase FemA/FemB family protein [Catenuloplanes niger]MDR7320873.1 lipid II:glycine glycyltransferase (peptidoglycan interpeptide bridge formation enzyme) [Catenuloplanes niger]
MSQTTSETWQSVTDEEAWDRQLFAQPRDGHFLQSSHWAAFQRANGREVYFGSGAGWQCLAIVERAGDACRLYCPYGPVADDLTALERAVEALQELGKREGAGFIRVEPWAPVTRDDLVKLGHFPSKRNMQPGLTWVQDLPGKTKDQLVLEFAPNVRNRWRNAYKKDISVVSSTNPDDVEILLQMIHDVSNHTGMIPHDDDYYRRQTKTLLERGAGTLYITKHGEQPIAAAIVYESPTTRYYAHSGSLLEARKLHSGTVMLATMVLEAQERGQQVFDFVGAAPKDEPDHPWAGFTEFKQSFGGRYRQYLGTWEMPCLGLAPAQQ